ncbi:hypothetical protein KFK09_009107 [Dendrobium nobile]|uniref:Uncharacterized protein n=1 Tax=Dendrobium nobile TaxID=94219 RepID=A0A8T3BR74_DENNO|nr:hypothetical protein KFK09_009107 [Dendrobium nobile]
MASWLRNSHSLQQICFILHQALFSCLYLTMAHCQKLWLSANRFASAIEVDGLKNSVSDDSIPCEYEKIEFPDLKVVNENKMMVSEYFGIPCNNLVSQNSDDCSDNDAGVKIVESFSTENNHDSFEFLGDDTPLSCVSSDVSSLMAPTTSEAIAEPSLLQKSKETEVAEDGSVSSIVGKRRHMEAAH